MKIPALFISLALCLPAGAALAHPAGHDGEYGDRYERHGLYERYHGPAHYAGHGRLARCDEDRPWVHERHHRRQRWSGGAGPCHDIHRGERLPRRYWSERYQVHDWRRLDLPRPWRGHDWVRTGHDFVLVERGSGIIGKVILLRHRD